MPRMKSAIQNNFTLRFLNKSTEEEFQNHFSRTTALSNQRSLYVSMALWIVIALVIFIGHPETTMVFLVDLSVLVILFITGFILAKSRPGKAINQWFVALSNIFSGMIIIHVTGFLMDDPTLFVVGIMLVIVMASTSLRILYFLILPVSFTNALVAQITLLVFQPFHGQSEGIIAIGIWSALIGALSGNYFLEQSERRVFLIQKELEEANHQLKMDTLQDSLTGLFNRQYLFERIREGISYFKRHGTPFFLAMLDLDHFKRINDELGHTTGDRVLQELGQLMQKSFRDTDVAARYGGEEFALILRDCDSDCIKAVLERFIEAVRTHDFTGVPWQVTCSAGLTKVESDDKPLDIVERADKLLYQSKKAGRDRVSI